MKVLVACEVSGIVRDAFTRAGHEATSCDLLPSDRPGRHVQGDVRRLIEREHWDLMIAFPPCTFLCYAGIHWENRYPERHAKRVEALEFVLYLLRAPIELIALENPVGIISGEIRKPDQIIQPWQFGEDASKKTCLWLKGLPKLKPTKIVPPERYVRGQPRWANQTNSSRNALSPSKDRAKIRSETYPGIAEAMAQQWPGRIRQHHFL